MIADLMSKFVAVTQLHLQCDSCGLNWIVSKVTRHGAAAYAHGQGWTVDGGHLVSCPECNGNQVDKGDGGS